VERGLKKVRCSMKKKRGKKSTVEREAHADRKISGLVAGVRYNDPQTRPQKKSMIFGGATGESRRVSWEGGGARRKDAKNHRKKGSQGSLRIDVIEWGGRE